MNLRTIYEGMRRRWYLLLVGLLATAGLATAAFLSASPSYTTTASVLLLPPKSLVGQRGNPYLNLAGLGAAVDVLATRMMASETAGDLTTSHPEAELTAEQDVTSSAPILLITVEAPSESLALDLRTQLTGLVEPTLDGMQDELSIAAGSRMTMSVLSADSEPDVSHRGQLRLVIVAVAAGTAFTVLSTAALDGILVRRRRRSGKLGADPAEGADTSPDTRDVDEFGWPVVNAPSRDRPGSIEDASTKSQERGPGRNDQTGAPTRSVIDAEAGARLDDWRVDAATELTSSAVSGSDPPADSGTLVVKDEADDQQLDGRQLCVDEESEPSTPSARGAGAALRT